VRLQDGKKERNMKRDERGQKDKVRINMTFTGPIAQRLTAVKNYYQVETYTDAVRLLISLAYEKIKPFGRQEEPRLVEKNKSES